MLPAHRIFWGLILLAAAGAGLLYNIIFAAGASPLAGFTVVTDEVVERT